MAYRLAGEPESADQWLAAYPQASTDGRQLTLNIHAPLLWVEAEGLQGTLLA
jgi:hypothetical protein